MRIRANEFGPIFKETIVNQTTVTITDLDEYAKVIKVDGKFPIRNELPPLAHYQRQRNMSLGLLNRYNELYFVTLAISYFMQINRSNLRGLINKRSDEKFTGLLIVITRQPCIAC